MHLMVSGEEGVKNVVSASDPFYCGVDVGASATKLVLLNNKKDIIAKVVKPSGVDYVATAAECLAQAVREAGVHADPAKTFSTGYGRHNVKFAEDSRTEIHCHGMGCYFYFPHSITIIDIGGQDNKVIRLD
ncbi:MAG: BadF/BadG/BcrA/BcrD ATPase family protein, partial [Candidatus Latescibacterota bacterium]